MYHRNVWCKYRKVPTRTTIIDVKGLYPFVNVSDGTLIIVNMSSSSKTDRLNLRLNRRVRVGKQQKTVR